MKVTLIHNPGAGDATQPTAGQLRALIKETGHKVRLQSTKEKGWAKVLKKNVDIVAVAGGDEGNGLGLDICRQFIESHGGEIKCQSQPEKGSTFFIRLPLLAAWCESDELFGAVRTYCHLFFGLGDGGALAFFQFANKDDQAQFGPKMPETPFHHVALKVDGDVQAAIESRLRAAGYEEPNVFVLEHGYCRSLYAVDPDGMIVEFTVDHPDVGPLGLDVGDAGGGVRMGVGAGRGAGRGRRARAPPAGPARRPARVLRAGAPRRGQDVVTPRRRRPPWLSRARPRRSAARRARLPSACARCAARRPCRARTPRRRRTPLRTARR